MKYSIKAQIEIMPMEAIIASLLVFVNAAIIGHIEQSADETLCQAKQVCDFCGLSTCHRRR